MKKKSVVLIIAVIVITYILMRLLFIIFNKNEDINSQIIKQISVQLIDTNNNLFHNLYKQTKVFELDSKTGYYKHCVGNLAPHTFKSECENFSDRIEVLHFFNSKIESKTDLFCIYFNPKTNDCKIGSSDSPTYSEKEILSR